MKNLFLIHLLENLKYYNNKKNYNILSESQGSVPNIDLYIEKITNYCSTIYQNNIEGKYNITIPQNLFDDINDKFFNNITINIDLELTTNNEKIIDGAYNPGFTSFSKYDNKIRNLTMTFNIKCKSYEVKHSLSIILSHEFIHAYHDYNILKNHNKSLSSQMIKDKYYNNLYNIIDENQIENKLKEIIYYIYNPEVNAYIGSIRSFIQKHGGLGKREEIINAVKKCPVFKIYENIEKNIQELSSIQDEILQKKLLLYWNNNTTFNKKSFPQMIKFIKRKINLIQNKIATITSKQLADYFHKKNIQEGFNIPFNKI